MNNLFSLRHSIILFSIAFIFQSCSLKPFFIPNPKKDKKNEKRIEKKIEKKNKAISKKEKKIETLSKNIKTTKEIELDSLKFIEAEKKLKQDEIVLFEERQKNASPYLENKIKYNTASIKTKMKYESGSDKQSFVANFRLEKDKKIWVTISAFSLEVARALITPDSILAYEKMNKNAYVLSYNQMKELINIDVDFNTLQDIIIGNSIGENVPIVDFAEKGGSVNIVFKGEDFLNQLTYNKSDSTLRQIQLQTTRGIYVSKINSLFGNYKLENNHKIASDRKYYYEDSKGSGSLEMEVQKISFNEDITFPFSIPEKYSRKK
ncbi:MAG: DUF4292 domain-containing protein [Chitinophagaceae bacterium]|nr:DUF4292 domain-containing protein [Chitinophagaceae bacterium]